MRKRDEPSLPLETLPSPVMAEDTNEELDETLKVSLVDSRFKELGLYLKMLGLVKSRVNVWF